MLQFYMDHHIPAAITDGLRRRGIDCLTADEDGAARTADARLLERAAQLSRILGSFDSDFLAITAEWLSIKNRFHGLVFANLNKLTPARAIEDLAIIAEVLGAQEVVDQIIFIPL